MPHLAILCTGIELQVPLSSWSISALAFLAAALKDSLVPGWDISVSLNDILCIGD